mmetsp:Transcript_135404/g.260131  ORF Transcript_135404/g.260131 Transcript_135404/m.260131 type:complete len:83 (-) Transcript_135404:25-273(-)
MANTGKANTGGSQIFINVTDNSFLDWFSPGKSKHPVFGKIVSGMDVIETMMKQPVFNDNPYTPIMMKKITISGVPDIFPSKL